MKTNDEIRRENLLLAIGRVGSAAKLAAMLGTAPAYLSQIKNQTPDSKSGTPKAMGDEIARRIEKVLDEPVGWVDTPHDDPSAASRNAVERVISPADLLPGAVGVHSAEKDDDGHVQIPMVSLRLQAGMTGYQTEPERRDGGTLGMRKAWIARMGYRAEDLIAIHVRGESMVPALFDDDLVVVNTADRNLVDGAVFAVNYEGEAVVKRLMRDAGDWWLTSDNVDQRKYYRKVCRGDACIIVGRIVWKEGPHI